MNNLKKIFKVTLLTLLVMSVCILPTFAVHQGGSTVYTSPFRLNFEVNGLVADLTPSLYYTPGVPYSLTNDENALLSNGDSVSVRRSRVNIQSAGQYNSAIKCDYQLSFESIPASDDIVLTITGADGFYDFQKYPIPQIAVPNGYIAQVTVSYEAYSARPDSTKVYYHDVDYSGNYTVGDSIPLLKDEWVIGGNAEDITSAIFIYNYIATVSFTMVGDDVLGSPGWYKWMPDVSDLPQDLLDVGAHEGEYMMWDCKDNTVFIAYVNSDFTLDYIPLSEIGFYFGTDTIEDWWIAYDTSGFMTDEPWVIYSVYEDAFYVPDPESYSGGDSILTGITPVTVKYIEFKDYVSYSIPFAPDVYLNWFFDNTEYQPSNPIVNLGYDSLIGSEWFINDFVSYDAVLDFYNAFNEYFPDGTPEGDAGFYEGVKIPLDFIGDDGIFGQFDYLFLEFHPVSDDTSSSIYVYAYFGSFDDQNMLFYGSGGSSGGIINLNKQCELIQLDSAPSPIAYEFLKTFCYLDRMPGYGDVFLPYSFVDGGTKIDVVYTLDTDYVLAQQYEDLINDYFDSAFSLGMMSGSGDFTGDYGSWLGTAVGGFMSFEIFPNFSLGGILGVCVAVGLLMMFLKFFAGG